MNKKNLSSISKIFLLILFLVTITSSTVNQNQLLAKTSAENQNYGPDKLNYVQNPQPDCEGLWISSDITKKIYLNAIYLKDWGKDTNPSLILDTYEKSKNFVIIGHNVCYQGKCDVARSQFANIIKLNIGDKVTACLGGVQYSGFIFTSSPIADTRTEVMTDWTGFNTITMFTSFGECKDSQCSSTQQRWMVAFERN